MSACNVCDVCELCGGDLGGRPRHEECSAEWERRRRTGTCTACGHAMVAEGQWCTACIESVPPEVRPMIHPAYRGYPGGWRG